MTQQDYTDHPITPPPELVRQWATTNGTHYEDLATLLQVERTTRPKVPLPTTTRDEAK